ncbi:MAG TPA: hypothetical protein DCX54_08670, partial [Flavobacteriales bacterium]|nr:hypothetical protein [Flavobacteriales bacterium]
EAQAAVSKGAKISDNAALMVGHELAAESAGKHTSLRLALLAQLCRERPSEAIQIAAPVIEPLIRDAAIPKEAVEQLLEYCRKTEGCYNALCILGLCSAGMEEEADKIRETWA